MTNKTVYDINFSPKSTQNGDKILQKESGLVLKKQADLFTIEISNGEEKTCVARKNLKKEGIFVGDRILLDENDAICKVEGRKNILIRPPVANIDKIFIVLAPVPKPDLYLVDKMILFCKVKNIEPVVCINKTDLDADYCEKVARIYEKIANVLTFSTLNESVKVILGEIKGICVLAGQSAVGKSSIINALKGEDLAKVDTFSKKIERGKQTTRTVQLFKFGQNKYLADTAGFSKLDETLIDLDYDEIKGYYPEFLKFAGQCKYKSCLHTGGKDCAVLKAVARGEIEKTRYENYLKLLEVVKNIKKY